MAWCMMRRSCGGSMRSRGSMTLRRGRGVGVGVRRGSGGTMMIGGAMAGDMMIETGKGIGIGTGMMAAGMEEVAVAMRDIGVDSQIN
jgi:hypothetical protein